jgi:hypothetical protein
LTKANSEATKNPFRKISRRIMNSQVKTPLGEASSASVPRNGNTIPKEIAMLIGS